MKKWIRLDATSGPVLLHVDEIRQARPAGETVTQLRTSNGEIEVHVPFAEFVEKLDALNG